MSQTKPDVIILGGGPAGLAAAKTLDQLGIGVHLVEKQAQLGGHAALWACMATDTCRYCGACLAAELVDHIQHCARTLVHLGTHLSGLERENGIFQAQLSGATKRTIQADAVLLATGFAPFDPAKIPELGYGVYNQVITTADLNSALRQERLNDILPATQAPAVAFIQCVGSRNRQLGHDYCSQVCCKTAVRQAAKVLHHLPEAKITVFHMDLQVIGKVFRTQAAELASQVTLRQGVPAKILNHLQEDKLSIIHEDADTGARTAAHFDLVVLAVGMVPAITPFAEIGPFLDGLGAAPNDWGFTSGAAIAPGAGIYVAGTAQGPMDILSARDQGIALAYRMAADLGQGRQINDPPTIAVLGGSAEAVALVQTLGAEGYVGLVLDPQEHPAPLGENITYYGGVALESVSGTVGQFDLTFTAAGERHKHRAAALVVAVGTNAIPIDSPAGGVQNLADFLGEFDGNPAALPEPIAFWLDKHGPEWKTNSRKCLETALALRAMGKRVIIIMEKMLVHGEYGQRLYDQARHAGVRFLRVCDPARMTVTPAAKGVVLEMAEATLPDVWLQVECGRLVIPEQIRPWPMARDLAQILCQEVDSEGFLQAANVRHRPVGSPRRGIFFLGSCHDECDPGDIDGEIRQVLSVLSMVPMLPTVLEPDKSPDEPALIDDGKCGRCLTCLRICPHGAVVLYDGQQPAVIPEACFGCGICISSCPARAITAGPSPPQVHAPPGKTILFACQRSAVLAAREAGLSSGEDDPALVIVPVPCAGRLDQGALLQPLLDGAQKVMVVGCHEGNCRSISGSRTAGARTRLLAAQTQALDLSISHHTIAANEPRKLAHLIAGSNSQKEEPHA